MCLYVRELTAAEGRRLQEIVRRDANRIKVRRAQVVLASAQGSKAPAIARRLYFSPQHVRTILKAFNAEGLDALVPKYGGGRPPEFSEEQQSLIVEAALCPPDLLGWPFRRWSLEKLRDHLVREKIVTTISRETLRQMLKARKVRLQRTKTWKECNDPQLRSKKN
jgi:transposase